MHSVQLGHILEAAIINIFILTADQMMDVYCEREARSDKPADSAVPLSL